MNIHEKIFKYGSVLLIVSIPFTYLAAYFAENNGKSSCAAENGIAASALWLLLNVLIFFLSFAMVIYYWIVKGKVNKNYKKWALAPVVADLIYISIFILIAIFE